MRTPREQQFYQLLEQAPPSVDWEIVQKLEQRAAEGATNERVMPTVLRVGPYRFFFFSADGGEPPHVHVERDEMIAKLWLRPVRLQESGGFSPLEIRRLEAIVTRNIDSLLRSWDDYFSD